MQIIFPKEIKDYTYLELFIYTELVLENKKNFKIQKFLEEKQLKMDKNIIETTQIFREKTNNVFVIKDMPFSNSENIVRIDYEILLKFFKNRTTFFIFINYFFNDIKNFENFKKIYNNIKYEFNLENYNMVNLDILFDKTKTFFEKKIKFENNTISYKNFLDEKILLVKNKILFNTYKILCFESYGKNKYVLLENLKNKNIKELIMFDIEKNLKSSLYNLWRKENFKNYEL